MDVSARKKMNRLWLFFVLIAVALVWTWSQVEQRKPSGMVSGEDIVLLRTEDGCDLAKGPCAAYLRDFAVVASARREGDGVAWRIKLVGEGGPELPELALQVLDRKGAVQQLAVLQHADGWLASSPRPVPSGSVLRVRILGGAIPMVADFPLVGGP